MAQRYMFKSFIILCFLSFTGFFNSVFSQVSSYTFAQTTGTYTAISGGTNVGFGTTWDDPAPVALTIPFVFNYNGNCYTSCNVSANGFITFGTAPAGNEYNPISSTGTYSGAVSALGRDLINNGVDVSYTTTGTAPDRVFIVQWNNARRYFSLAARNGNYRFQIRLYEATNVVQIMYNSATSTYATDIPVQIGLRGSSNTDYNNRTSATNFSTTTAGGANNATVVTGNTAAKNPTAGLTFTWTPPTASYRYYMYNLNYGSSTWCAGETRNVSVSIKNTGTSTWTNSSPDINVGIKWNTNGANWGDYHLRTDAGSVAPGATASYTFSMQAKNATAGPTWGSNLSTGSNNLTLDMVNEGNCWFGNNPGSCNGSGTATMNCLLVSPTITINPIPTSPNAGSDATICTGGSVNLSGSATGVTASGSTTFSYAASGDDCDNFYIGGTTSGIPSGANITSITYNPTIGPDCTAWYEWDLIVNGTYITSGCNATGLVYNGLNGSAANGQLLELRSWDNDAWCDAITMSVSFTVNYTYTSPVTYSWSPAGSLNNANIYNPVASPTSTTTYTMTATSGGCTASDAVAITVNPDPTAPSATKSPNTSYACPGATLTLTSSTYGTEAGMSCGFEYRSSTSGAVPSGAWSSTVPSFSAVAGVTNYIEIRVIGGCGNGCNASPGTLYSWTLDNLNAGAINTTTLNGCDGYNPANITSTTNASGGSGDYTYQWQLNGSDIGGANLNTFDPPALTPGTYVYVRNVTDNICGGTVSTASKTINIVNDPNAPTATKSPATASACLGSTLTLTNPTYGSEPGQSCGFEYGFSTDGGGSWSATSGTVPSFAATGTNNQIRVRVAPCGLLGCNSSPWTTYIWTIDPTSSVGAVSADQTICSGNQPSDMTIASATGTIQWQWSTDLAFTTPNNIGTNSLTLPGTTVGTLTATRYFRAEVTSGTCPSTTSSVITVNVNSLPSISSITVDNNPICSSDTTTLAAIGVSGTGATVTWWTGTGGTGTNLGTGNILRGGPGTYYARVTGACTPAVESSITVNSFSPTSLVHSGTTGTTSATCTYPGAIAGTKQLINSSGEVFVGINENGNNLGDVTCTVIRSASTPTMTNNISCYSQPGGEFYMPREFDITVQNQPSSNVDVVFYFTSSELSMLTASSTAASVDYKHCYGEVNSTSDLMITVDHGGGVYETKTPTYSTTTIGGTTYNTASISVSQFSGFRFHSNGGVHGNNTLPVTYATFTAQDINNSYIRLDWVTLTEINNDGFEVQRSTDGVSFTTLGWVEGNDNSNSPKVYSFDDRNTLPNIQYYYRLKQIDNNTQFEYSNMVTAALTGETIFTISPNPATDRLNVKFEGLSNGKGTISIVNAVGQVVIEKNNEVVSGINNYELDVRNLPQGTYTVSFSSNSEIKTAKLIIAR